MPLSQDPIECQSNEAGLHYVLLIHMKFVVRIYQFKEVRNL